MKSYVYSVANYNEKYSEYLEQRKIIKIFVLALASIETEWFTRYPKQLT